MWSHGGDGSFSTSGRLCCVWWVLLVRSIFTGSQLTKVPGRVDRYRREGDVWVRCMSGGMTEPEESGGKRGKGEYLNQLNQIHVNILQRKSRFWVKSIPITLSSQLCYIKPLITIIYDIKSYIQDPKPHIYVWYIKPLKRSMRLSTHECSDWDS